MQVETKKTNILKALQSREMYGKMPSQSGTKVYLSLGKFIQTKRLSGKDKPNYQVRTISQD